MRRHPSKLCSSERNSVLRHPLLTRKVSLYPCSVAQARPPTRRSSTFSSADIYRRHHSATGSTVTFADLPSRPPSMRSRRVSVPAFDVAPSPPLVSTADTVPPVPPIPTEFSDSHSPSDPFGSEYSASGQVTPSSPDSRHRFLANSRSTSQSNLSTISHPSGQISVSKMCDHRLSGS